MTKLENNKRIAKNTSFLYVSMFLTLLVSLYTSRIVLDALGVVDYGIYNVVGGVVTLFSFLSSSLSSATQRFITFELGKNDVIAIKRIFSMSINIYLAIAILIFILSETIGLWFLNNKLSIPIDRMNAANWVYQFSVFTFLITIIRIPYNALIIAHERMKAYAYINIVEVFLKLISAFILINIGFDKLVFYSFLIFIIPSLINICYYLYSKRNFSEFNYYYFWDIELFKTLLNFAGWNMFGNLASVSMNQGINIILNLFFGPTVNAARAIALQVSMAVNSFVQNFQLALNPQIIKSYASQDLKYTHNLIFKSSKFSFFLLFFLTLPILTETEYILLIWLKIVPKYTVIFTRLIIITILIDSISGSLMTAAQASGKIKLYISVVGIMLILILPISYIFLYYGYKPEVTLKINIIIAILALFVRLLIISPLVKMSIYDYIRNVIFKIVPVVIISISIVFIFENYFITSYTKLLVITLVSFTSTLFLVYFIGLTKGEKSFIIDRIKTSYRILSKTNKRS